MAITINGNGTITGISAGGLPAGTVTSATLASGVGGKILQVVQTTKTDTFQTASSSYVDVTGLSLSITPSATTSKILIGVNIGFVSGSHTGNQAVYPQFQIVRDSTAIALGDASGNRTRCTFSVLTNLHGGYNGTSAAFEFLDSPSTTSAITYKIQWRIAQSSNGTLYLNRTGRDENTYHYARTASSFTLYEVSA